MLNVLRRWFKELSEINSGKRKYYFLIAILISPPLAATNHTEEDELNYLMELLNQQTTIATQTRLNADYVPGMVSIMTGEDMQQRGFATLWDALGYLPGVQQNIDATGKRNIIVRGLGKATETSKIKIQLNHISINQSTSATSSTLFDTPVNQIDKIEFVRGPGSAIHGEYALMGVLNVITKKFGNSLSAGIDSNKRKNINALYQFGSINDAIHGSINVALSDSDGEDIEVRNDNTPASITGYAPGTINNKRDNVSAIFDISISGLDLSLQYQQSNRGDYFGINNYLPPPEKQTVISDTVVTFNLAQDFSLSDNLTGQWNVTQIITSTEKNSLFLGVAPIFSGFDNQDDVVSDVDQEEHRNTISLNLNYESEKHTIYSEVSLAEITVEKSRQYINRDPFTLLPTNIMYEYPTPVPEGQQRKIKSLVLQDEYALNDALTITSGLRYDDFNNEYNNVAPRVALVWILSKENIFKFQYAEAFRPPTLRETGGALDQNINPEKNRTTELAYIYNSNDVLLKNTLYSSEIEDYIVFIDTAPFGYKNIRGAELTGYELELNATLSPKISLDSNLTLQQSRDLTTGRELYGSTPLLFTFGGTYELNALSKLNVQLKHVSDQVRETTDSRGDLAPMTQLDITWSRKDIFNIDGVHLATGIRNLLRQKIRYLAAADTYTDDYLIDDSITFWLQLEYTPE